jgi:broad specificity phosphatase PhoE
VAYLILIKHSLPEIAPTVRAAEWHLSESGRQRCHALAERVARYAPQMVVHSVEPKAEETAQLLARYLYLTCRAMAGLHEHVRDIDPLFTQARFEAQVAAFFARPGELVFGRETADQAHARFAGAISAALAQAAGRNLAFVAHGTVITLFVARAVGLEPFPLWQRLGLPSFVALAPPEMRLLAVAEQIGDDAPA